jgi:branched-chain amino acid transport system ATP-binding protein
VRPHQLAGLGIARTLQGLGLFPHISCLENVMVGAHRHARAGFTTALLGLPRSDRDEAALRERSLAILDELGVADVAGRLPGSLPYPLQKRVSLARALVADPEILLLDEPASGLSAAEMDELGELIRGLRGRMAVMLVEHHMDLVMSVCDRIVVLDFGKMIATGTPAEVRADDRVLAAYLGDEVDANDESISEVPRA